MAFPMKLFILLFITEQGITNFLLTLGALVRGKLLIIMKVEL